MPLAASIVIFALTVTAELKVEVPFSVAAPSTTSVPLDASVVLAFTSEPETVAKRTREPVIVEFRLNELLPFRLNPWPA